MRREHTIRRQSLVLVAVAAAFFLLCTGIVWPSDQPPPTDYAEVFSALDRALHSEPVVGRHNRTAFVPAYAIPCSYGDCHLIATQLKSIDVPVGHIHLLFTVDPSDKKRTESITAFANALRTRYPYRLHATVSEQWRSVAESWNFLLQSAFRHASYPAWVFLTNADIEMHSFWLPFFASYANVVLDPSNRTRAGVRTIGFSGFALARDAYAKMGPFDEVIFPGYGEDDEYIMRSTSLGEFYDTFPDRIDLAVRDFATIHHGGGASSTRSSKMRQAKDRWDKTEYIFRKWGIDLSKCHAPNTKDFTERFTPFAYPFNLSSISHQHSFKIDPKHRECLITGVGPRLLFRNESVDTKTGLCYGPTPCDACWYDYGLHVRALAGLPPTAELPERLTSQWRQQY